MYEGSSFIFQCVFIEHYRVAGTVLGSNDANQTIFIYISLAPRSLDPTGGEA